MRSFLAILWTAWSSRKYSPVQALSCMPSRCSSVLFPAPEGPMMDMKSPSFTSRLMRRRTNVLVGPCSKYFSTLRSWIIGVRFLSYAFLGTPIERRVGTHRGLRGSPTLEPRELRHIGQRAQMRHGRHLRRRRYSRRIGKPGRQDADALIVDNSDAHAIGQANRRVIGKITRHEHDQHDKEQREGIYISGHYTTPTLLLACSSTIRPS